MASKIARVVVHRWFADGEGWAHDSSMTAGEVLEIMERFDRELKGTGEALFDAEILGGWLIGERRLDPDTEDRLAKHRSPTVFRVAVLKHKPSDEEVMLLRQQLAHVLPAVRGIQPLRIELPLPPPQTITTSERGAHRLTVVCAGVFLAMLVIVGWKFVQYLAGPYPGKNVGGMPTSAPSDAKASPSSASISASKPVATTRAIKHGMQDN